MDETLELSILESVTVLEAVVGASQETLAKGRAPARGRLARGSRHRGQRRKYHDIASVASSCGVFTPTGDHA